MSAVPTPVEVFCSYAHEDEVWLRKLERHLSLLKRQGLLSLWYDRLITPGTNWAQAIDTRLETASIILLLVSADFFASNYCVGIEMKRALERQEAGEALVIPILVRPVNWKDAPFAHLQALPTNAKPLTTWRKQDRVLTDIATGIRRAIEDMPLLAASVPRTALPEIWNIPYPRNSFFLGRETELALVRHHLQAGQATALSQPQAISGLGGIGKTQLALEYAYRYHQDYQMVLWARAESTEALVSSYLTLASLLRLPEREAKEQEVAVQAVKSWLQTHCGWLLILDNADELALLPDFLPPSAGGHLLLTTRASATGRLAHRLEIETLALQQGALLLLRRAGMLAADATLEQAPSQERMLAVQISQELGGLPLALDQAGAYLEETGMNLISYWQIYHQHCTELLRRRGGLVSDHPESVATTWSLSFQMVQAKQPAAADLLRLCAFLSPDAITEEIMAAGASVLGPILQPVAANPFLLSQAIEELRAYSLVRRDPRKNLLSIHRLVQAVLKSELEETERRNWAERAVLAVNATFPASEYGAWQQCERLLPHALLVAQFIEVYHITQVEAGRLLHETASYLRERARYREAEPLFQSAISIFELQMGFDHPEVASPLNDLAKLYSVQGKYEQAEPLYQRALRIWEQSLGPEHPRMASSLSGLASLYSRQGKYEQAKSLYQRALRIREQSLGPEHPHLAPLLNGLAMIDAHQSKYKQAEPLYQRVVRIWEQNLLPEHPEVAVALNRLAQLYSKQSKYEQAEPLYLRALHISEQSLGPEHPEVASPLNNLAHLYSDQSKYEQAEPLYQRALHIREQSLGPEHPHVAFSLSGLAHLYFRQGKYEQAEPLYQRALHIREQSLGPEHPEIAFSLNNLAHLYSRQGKYGQAEPLYQRALYILAQSLGPEHLEMASPISGLANLYRIQGKYEQARLLYQRALHISEQKLGPTHPEVASSLNGLANLCRDQQSDAEAETFYQRALHIRKQALGPQHADLAEILRDLAAFREVQSNNQEAILLYQQALTIREQVFGPQHLYTIEIREHLCTILHVLDRAEEVAQLEAKRPEQI